MTPRWKTWWIVLVNGAIEARVTNTAIRSFAWAAAQREFKDMPLDLIPWSEASSEQRKFAAEKPEILMRANDPGNELGHPEPIDWKRFYRSDKP